MSFLSVLFEYKGVILFYSFIVLLVYLNRKKLTQEAPLVYLYKTSIGLDLMDNMAKRFRKLVKIFGYISIVLGYIGFFLVGYLLLKNAYDIVIEKPGAMGGSPVIPGLPIAGLGVTFPLIIGWISLFIIMIVHEFSHGVVARAYNIKVKSSGIAFFGPILGAFVEPDEKEMVKQSYVVQNSVYSAGPISNVILWGVCLLILMGLTSIAVNMTFTRGVTVNTIKNESLPAFSAGIPDNTTIVAINDRPTTNLTALNMELDSLSPGENITVKSISGDVYKLTTVSNPGNSSRAYLGILLIQEDRKLKDKTPLNDVLYKILLWFFELFTWTAFISLNIGLINLFPIFITDGARILKANTDHFFKKDQKLGDAVWKNVSLVAVFVILILLFLPLVRNIFGVVASLFLTLLKIGK